ncbi:rhodanese-like domain-containing protein [Desulfocurvibacter africanus]|uniref:Rhodanese-like protein n=1 Tax=Desulfocurvibacter africanus subsp. africanus str. Walvis Bay TaxID=690850 RepID=F3YUF7_DESAF|nr:rhodanese-like domain-containing protein [Desulfocurvibacter africanus]EGJ48839.1 Rhodanese-like protein [Desulfocurvibacter africanus subsp. africanus str. Walvis Bay]
MNDEQDVQTFSAQKLRDFINTHSESEYDLIDVRQPSEYEVSHIPGAKLLPLKEFVEHLGDIHPDRENIFYCSVGGRSMAAAVMAAESGAFRKGIYTLDGGIAAWNGKSLPDRPPLRLFESSRTLREALLTALELEKGSWLFYTELLKAPPKRFSCSSIQELADIKKSNAKILHDTFKVVSSEEETEHMAPFEELFESLGGNIMASGDDPTPLLVWAKANYEDCEQLINLAVELEYRAYDLYRNMAFDAKNAEEEQAFLELSKREKSLLVRIAGEMDKAMAEIGRAA